MKKNITYHEESLQGERGFTLIEIMIAILVFSVGILGIALLQVHSLKGNADSMKITEATMWAVNQAEEFMDQEYDSSDLTVGQHGPVSAANPIFELSWDVAEVTSNTKNVSITVDWASGNRNRKLTFNYLKSIF